MIDAAKILTELNDILAGTEQIARDALAENAALRAELSDFRKMHEIYVQETVEQRAELAAMKSQKPVAYAIYDIKHGGSKTLIWPDQYIDCGDKDQFKAVSLYGEKE